MTESYDSNALVLQQADALSINVSSEGLLLLMPITPALQQVFEVYKPVPEEEATDLTLVETRWTREISVDPDQRACLVGVKVLRTFVLSSAPNRF